MSSLQSKVMVACALALLAGAEGISLLGKPRPPPSPRLAAAQVVDDACRRLVAPRLAPPAWTHSSWLAMTLAIISRGE